VAERRRALAEQVTRWVQEESRSRYRDDGAVDFWPTFDETLAAGEEDCDGLELLTYHALQELGFSERELFRAILRHQSFDMHHMVTLWFEDPSDPWVLDPTGNITTAMRRMSQIDYWVPVKLFTESIEYTVHPHP
jgi:predicted transglutaminase-like cysteine proteinase